MAATAAMTSVSIVAAPAAAIKLSSAAAFGSSQAQFAPLRNVHAKSGRVVAVTANSSGEELECSSVRQVMSSVLAAGLAITIAGSAFAAEGPGGKGAERTARKADELLQGADKLIKNDSPQRFGPGEWHDSPQRKGPEEWHDSPKREGPEEWHGKGTATKDVDRFSQKAGSGAILELQDATSAQVSGARDNFASNVKKIQHRIDGIWGLGKALAND